MKKSTLSVITPTFNCSEYITRSYNNLCNQSYDNWEWIVVNDGSTDDSYELINRISATDNRVIVHHFEHNKGRGAAREFAISMCRTDCIVVWDIDDLYDFERLSIINKSLIINKFDFFCSYALVVTNDFKLKGGRHFYPDIVHSPSFVHPTLAFNKNKIKMESFYSVDMRAGEDFNLMMQLDKYYNGDYFEEYLMLYFEDREINLNKTIDVYSSHYKSFELYLKDASISWIKKTIQLLKMKVKILIIKCFIVCPSLYLKTIKYRKIDLVDLSAIGLSIFKLVEYEKNKIIK